MPRNARVRLYAYTIRVRLYSVPVPRTAVRVQLYRVFGVREGDLYSLTCTPMHIRECS